MNYLCEYCGSSFVNAKNLEKHLCDNKKKSLIVQSKLGKSAFIDYKIWRQKRGYAAATNYSFLTSRYFKSFINFVEFSKEKLIPDKEGYINLMIEKNVEPSHWTRAEYYDYYKEMFDKIYSPIKQYEMSLDYLMRLSNAANCKLSEILDNVPPIDLMKLISSRKLSPWLLLFMNSFQDLLKYKLSTENKLLMNAIINFDIWKNKLSKNTSDAEAIRSAVRRLNI